MKPTLLLAAVWLLVGCATQHGFNRAAFLQRPERQLATYHARLDADIADRVQPAPPAIIRYLDRMDSTDQYSPYTLSPDELKLFLQYFALLPAKYRDTIQRSVVGIYFISNFAGGGMSDFLYDEKGKLYIALYFNPELLHKSVAEWLEYRENASFLDDGNVQIKVASANNYRGLIQTLVHEASHIYDYYYHVTPYVEPFFRQGETSISKTFTRGVWQDYRVPAPGLDFLRPTKFSGYGLNGKIDRSEAVGLYSQLGRSPFSSLYGALSWAEDFAETFTWYYLQAKLGISYQVTVVKGGKTVAEFAPGHNSLIWARYSQLAEIAP